MPDEILAPIKLIFHSPLCYYFYQFILGVVVFHIQYFFFVVAADFVLRIFVKAIAVAFYILWRVNHNTRDNEGTAQWVPVYSSSFLSFCVESNSLLLFRVDLLFCNAICIILISLGKTCRSEKLSGSVAIYLI